MRDKKKNDDPSFTFGDDSHVPCKEYQDDVNEKIVNSLGLGVPKHFFNTNRNDPNLACRMMFVSVAANGDLVQLLHS